MEVDSDSGSRRLALIKAVRTLDEDGTIALPDRIRRLWDLLAATKSTRFHGVEENILRWLFKHMSGNTDDAEQVRRYPLTWSILSHIFSKIPPQTLGRSLGSIRFVSVLHKTVGDVTTARKQPSGSSNETSGEVQEKTKKRKRDAEFPSDIVELRTPRGCIKSATELFKALSSLLEQGGNGAVSTTPERRVGVEHIKSLFSSSNEETRDIAAGLLLTCDRSLSVLDGGISQDQEAWIHTVATLWNLRLHSKDDNVEFARHMYVPASSILTRLRGIAGVAPVMVASDTVKKLWVRQLEQFLSAYFIRPARHAFATDESVEVLETALEVSKRNLGGSAIVTWDVAARTPRDSSNPKSKAEHSSWTQNVFRVLLNAVQPLESVVRNRVIVQLLETAIQTGSAPNTAALRAVCREYALGSDETDWNLIAKVVICDADVFLMEDGLLIDVLGRINSYSNRDASIRETIVTDIILPLEDAFAKARNFSGFIQKWYDCLCDSAKDSLDQSVWFDARVRQRVAKTLQTALTNTQLLRVLEHLGSSDAPSGPLLVVLDGISAGISEEDFIQTADPVIFSTVFKDKTYKKLPSSVLSLRWRIAGRMASWETSNEVERLWAELKSTMKPVLKKGALSDEETFEAFSCCHKFWLANYPRGKHDTDLAKLARSFLERLVSEVKVAGHLSSSQRYLDHVFRFLPKLAELPGQEASGLKELIVDLFWYVGRQFMADDDARLSSLLRSLLHNYDCEDEEALIDSLISQPLDALDGAEDQSGWTEPQSLPLLLILLDFPREALTKGRRKRIMSSWKKWRSAIATHASQDPQFAAAVLRLLVGVMHQPTFYEGMEFDDLIYITSHMWKDDKNIIMLLEKLVDLTLRQMAVSAEGPSPTYLTDASNFTRGLKPKYSKNMSAQILLVKGLASALQNSPSSKPYSSVISLEEVTEKLEQLVWAALSGFASESRMTETPTEVVSLTQLSLTLGGAACITDTRGKGSIKLSQDTINQLEDVSMSYISKNVDIGWKLRAFLFRNYPDRYDMGALCTQLEHASPTIEEDLVYNLVDAFVMAKDRAARDRCLNELVDSGKLTAGSIGPLLAVRRLVELHQGLSTSSPSGEDQDTVDLGVVHERLASLLSRAESLRHFKYLAETLVLLLDKHANSMTQFNIETTLGSVIRVCSRTGPKIQTRKAAGEIYDRLYKLVALVLKRHRLRLRGHFPILLTTLRALLITLLAEPSSDIANAAFSHARPPWLESRLQSRHAELFTRLLTLICEPSAASVARARSSDLDSATDAAKRAAGQDMFTVLELYIKLQLEVTVPRDIRKALEPGVYSVLDITPQGCRRILNESLDANGRAIFRQMFADYKKFGKWTGV
ncbi:Urb2/Npa2 family-domain-containing protein [Hypomontagnella submonticulosa]|nr:Urb2/Npa2 family-domain-containing protein [Hypomontagnella submonticulosa]